MANRELLYLARNRTQQVPSATGMLHQPSPAPPGSLSSWTELNRGVSDKKKGVSVSTGSACPAISCDQRMQTAAYLSSLAIKAAADLLRPQPAATGKEQPQTEEGTASEHPGCV